MLNLLELETKILEINHIDLESKLIKLGAKKVFDGDIKTLKLIDQNGEKIRIRDDGTTVSIIQKEKIESEVNWVKVRIERTIREETHKNFDILVYYYLSRGFLIARETIKKRVSYILKNDETRDFVMFDFDKYLKIFDKSLLIESNKSEIPEFLEIEASNIDIIRKYVAELGFTSKDCFSWGINKLLMYYFFKQSLNDR